ncbi:hypothetical protein [Streptomyces sp. NPDC005969]|uniref:hypothetical protein n=1 Tax=Streptomyces sp. NPDC005969 TaxID=3156722 RepID=UPI00340C9B97
MGRIEVRVHDPLGDPAVVRRQRKPDQYQPDAQQQREQTAGVPRMPSLRSRPRSSSDASGSGACAVGRAAVLAVIRAIRT